MCPRHENSLETIVKNEQQFERIIAMLPFSLSIITLDGTVLYVNPKGMEYLEIGLEVIGQKAAMMHWVNPERRLVWLDKIKNEGSAIDFEMHVRTATGDL
ncbi:MAG: hypothetical protein AB7D35_11840 [Bacteroidales bacterium]|jgi:PAS domain-containing protein